MVKRMEGERLFMRTEISMTGSGTKDRSMAMVVIETIKRIQITKVFGRKVNSVVKRIVLMSMHFNFHDNNNKHLYITPFLIGIINQITTKLTSCDEK